MIHWCLTSPLGKWCRCQSIYSWDPTFYSSQAWNGSNNQSFGILLGVEGTEPSVVERGLLSRAIRECTDWVVGLISENKTEIRIVWTRAIRKVDWYSQTVTFFYKVFEGHAGQDCIWVVFVGFLKKGIQEFLYWSMPASKMASYQASQSCSWYSTHETSTGPIVPWST